MASRILTELLNRKANLVQVMLAENLTKETEIELYGKIELLNADIRVVQETDGGVLI